MVAPSHRWVTLMGWAIPSTTIVCGQSPSGKDSRHGMRANRQRSAHMKPACLAAAALVFLASPAAAQHQHPPQDQALHEKFYSTWYMPDNRAKSCCNNADCYPTEVKVAGGNIYARRREDGKYILIPPKKIERNRDNPDGSNDLCAQQTPRQHQPNSDDRLSL